MPYQIVLQYGNSQNIFCLVQLCSTPYLQSLEGEASVTLGNLETLSQI